MGRFLKQLNDYQLFLLCFPPSLSVPSRILTDFSHVLVSKSSALKVWFLNWIVLPTHYYRTLTKRFSALIRQCTSAQSERVKGRCSAPHRLLSSHVSYLNVDLLNGFWLNSSEVWWKKKERQNVYFVSLFYYCTLFIAQIYTAHSSCLLPWEHWRLRCFGSLYFGFLRLIPLLVRQMLGIPT